MPNSPAHMMIPGMMGQGQQQSYQNNTGTYSSQTIAHLTGLEGVPFVLRDDLRPATGLGSVVV